MPSLTVVSASKKARKSGGAIPKGKLLHIHVEPMDNGGFSIESRHKVEPRKPKKGSMMAEPMDFDAGLHKAGFADAASAHAHLGTLMGAGTPPAAPDAAMPPEPGAEPTPPAPATPDDSGA
jgi:hypothetical protein